ncbi:MAG: TRAP transporter substrate-binding protein [bacterium]|nr:TRAP transporter substrate-binding protein [bacterium]
MRKYILLLTVTLVLSSVFMVGNSGGSETGKVYTLNLSHHVPLSHPLQDWSLNLSKIAKEKSDGRLVIDVFGAGQLGGLKDNTEGVGYGTIDMAIIDFGTLGTMIPKLGTVALPFMFDTFDHVEKFYDGELGKELADEILEKLNVKVLNYSHGGFRVVASKRPLNSIDDFKLLKIRVPEVPVYVDTFKAIGTNPTPIPWGEVYTSLQTGVVEAVENPPDGLYTTKLQEVTKYLTRTNHIYVDVMMTINKGIFESLPEDLRTILQEASDEATVAHRVQVIENDTVNYADLLDSGMTETTIPSQDLKDKVSHVWGDFAAKTTGAQEMIDAIRGLAD